MSSSIYGLLGIKDRDSLKKVARTVQISLKKLENYEENMLIPVGSDLNKILEYLHMEETEFNIAIGNYTANIADVIDNHKEELLKWVKQESPSVTDIIQNETKPILETEHGRLFQGDSLMLMKELEDESVDLIFADPPFNIGKEYESKINDRMESSAYLQWTQKWIDEAIRILKPGGSIFVWNLPKWNIYISNMLGRNLNYRDWVAVDMTSGMPIINHLYPAHYSLIYYVKGMKPNTFNNERIPLDVCKYCGHELKDYGGYKKKMNPNGVNLSNVWHDIYPVRHPKYKNRKSNELSLKLLDRIISIATNPGDTVLDPFGGSGTTYIASELNHRNWIGYEIGPVDQIVDRLSNVDFEREQLEKIHQTKNTLFLPKIREKRKAKGYWLSEDK